MISQDPSSFCISQTSELNEDVERHLPCIPQDFSGDTNLRNSPYKTYHLVGGGGREGRGGEIVRRDTAPGASFLPLQLVFHWCRNLCGILPVIRYIYSHYTFCDWKMNYKINPLAPLSDGHGPRFHLSSDFYKL